MTYALKGSKRTKINQERDLGDMEEFDGKYQCTMQQR